MKLDFGCFYNTLPIDVGYSFFYIIIDIHLIIYILTPLFYSDKNKWRGNCHRTKATKERPIISPLRGTIEIHILRSGQFGGNLTAVYFACFIFTFFSPKKYFFISLLFFMFATKCIKIFFKKTFIRALKNLLRNRWPLINYLKFSHGREHCPFCCESANIIYPDILDTFFHFWVKTNTMVKLKTNFYREIS